jgi:superfamily II DNA or RNA helicase
MAAISFYLYVASAPLYQSENTWKLGCTGEPRKRLSTYLTGCPPGFAPSVCIEYHALFLTRAKDEEELRAFEDELLDAFLPFRLMRRIAGDTEWFRFPPGRDALAAVAAFVEQQPWFLRRVAPETAIAADKGRSLMARSYYRNAKFVRAAEARNQKLSALQEPEIAKLCEFLRNPGRRAGYLVAPCGVGKTRMACRAIAKEGLRRCVVAAPTILVEDQWARELIESAAFAAEEVRRFVALPGEEALSAFLARDCFCLVVNRASTARLLNLLTPALQLLVLDECHHFAGEATEEAEGVGSTRALVLRARELAVKQLGLTYTPRVVRGERELKLISMDDPVFFGAKVFEMFLKNLIEAGVLPDYRIWLLSDSQRKTSGLIGKLGLLQEAWRAREEWHDEERYIFNHLVIYTRTNAEAEAIEVLMKDTKNTEVIRVQGGQDLTEPLKRFDTASRAILLNCKILAEGADIPRADSVFITYHKESRAEITQMLLRPGRWREGKPLFHILLTLTDEDDLSAVEEVLLSLASFDERLKEEIIRRSAPSFKNAEGDDGDASSLAVNIPELIVSQQYKGSDLEEAQRCFAKVRQLLTPRADWREIQRQCATAGIGTSFDYKWWRENRPELPEDPRPAGQTWFAFLHSASQLISETEFARLVFEGTSSPASPEAYDALRLNRGDPTMPSVQHILDGCYGAGKTFETLLAKYDEGHRSKRR